MIFAPVCLFTYNRFEETKQTIEALQKNYLAKDSCLYIFSDGAKDNSMNENVKEIRKYLKTISGFKSIEIIESDNNKGLKRSIIEGVSQVIEKYKKVIVLEDDLITSPNFLNFSNQALDFYKNNKHVYSISGFTLDLPSLKCVEKDYYLYKRISSWGWSTWIDRWVTIDWNVNDYESFKWNFIKQLRFAKIGSDLPFMLWKQMNGKIDSWAIISCYNQFNRDLVTVYPTISKVKNIGYGELATHTKGTRRFHTILDIGDKTVFKFNNEIIKEIQLEKEFKNKFSILTRLKDKL